MRVLFFMLISLLPFSGVMATEDFYHFNTEQQQQRFELLTTELRCLVCQNQNLAESNAALATDLRGQIYQKIQQGESNQAIIKYLVVRYGNFILYNPPINAYTIGLWFGPFLLLIIGIGYLMYYIKKNAGKKP